MTDEYKLVQTYAACLNYVARKKKVSNQLKDMSQLLGNVKQSKTKPGRGKEETMEDNSNDCESIYMAELKHNPHLISVQILNPLNWMVWRIVIEKHMICFYINKANKIRKYPFFKSMLTMKSLVWAYV